MKQQLTPRWKSWLLALVGGLLLSACLPEGTRMPESPLLPSLERKSGLIAYVGTDSNIYTINQAGGDRQAITDDAGRVAGSNEIVLYEGPVWSPDGERLAFEQLRGEQGTLTQTRIYVAEVDDGTLTEVFRSTRADGQVPIYLYWSPDSSTLTFLTSDENDLTLWGVNVEGGEAQAWDNGSPFYWVWAPESDRLLAHVDAGEAGGRLVEIQPGDDVSRRSLSVNPGRFQAPAWSPDGKRLLLALDGEAGGEPDRLAISGLNGGIQEQVAELERGAAFAWSPDGKRIAYIASQNERQSGVFGPLTVTQPGKPDKTLTVEEGGLPVLAFFWSPNSRQIAYLQVLPSPPDREEPDDDAEPGQEAAGYRKPARQDTPGVFLRLRVLNVRNGKTHTVETFQPTERFLSILPFFDQYQRSATIWSPDSESIVVAAYNREETPSIWVLAASGALEPRRIAEGQMAYWSWK